MSTLVYRIPYGDTFTYRYSDGKTIKNRALRRWFKQLAIPPAWQDVSIDLDRDARIHAFGRDQKNKKQYIYNPQWTKSASEKKFQRILRFGQQLKAMRRITGQHLKQRPINENTVLACMTRMLDEAYFRPGNIHYTDSNSSYGLTTLRMRHMQVKDHAIVFDYKGKSGQQQHREIVNTQLRSVLLELEDMTGYELFDVTLPDNSRRQFQASDLNYYIGEVMGEDFSAKDFRTWAGTVLTAAALREVGPSDDSKTCQSNILQAIKSAAEKLGNTPAICRSSYVHPNVILHYENGITLDYFKRQLKNSRSSSQQLTWDEKATVKLLLKAIG